MKITKNQRIETLERKVAGLTTMLTMLQVWSDHADNMLTELNHALPDPEYDDKCEAQEADIDASLDRHRERLGLNKPQLKQLDQSVFDGLDEKWRWAAVDENGRAHKYEQRPDNSPYGEFLVNINEYSCDYELIGEGYDASNWQNSLIERDDIAKKLAEVDLSSELTGSDLCRAMLARGDKYVLCHLSQTGEKPAKDVLGIAIGHDHSGFRVQRHNSWRYAVPINNQGEPLTASEVGL